MANPVCHQSDINVWISQYNFSPVLYTSEVNNPFFSESDDSLITIPIARNDNYKLALMRPEQWFFGHLLFSFYKNMSLNMLINLI